MSIIIEEVWSRVSEKRLVQLRSRVRSDPNIRAMYLTEDLYEEVSTERDDVKEDERFARLLADLEQFITSRTLDSKYLFGITPACDGVWEIRSVRPDPQIRVFGMFAAKDIFIATHMGLRSDLGKYGSKEWNDAIKRTKAIWRTLFPTCGPKIAGIHDLISGGLDERYFKQ